MLRIALPNGTLEEQTVKLFHNAGIRFERSTRRYRAEASDPRIARVVFMRPHIIPYVVGKGLYDLGITGSDLVAEADGCRATVIAKLRYGRTQGHDWRLVVLSAQENPATSLREIEDNAAILSEYPRITQKALERVGKRAQIHFSHGSTEANVSNDFPYGVCIASSGTTLKANQLKIIEVLSVETAVIVGGSKRIENREKELASISLVDDLLR